VVASLSTYQVELRPVLWFYYYFISKNFTEGIHYMKKISSQKYLLTGTSVFAVAALSVAAVPSQAFAAFQPNATITTAVTGAHTAQANAAETLTISNGGDISGANNGAVLINGATAAVVGITQTGANINTLGINVTGAGNSAITVNGTNGTFATITNTAGKVSSANTGGTGGTIVLNSTAAQATVVTNTGTITNTDTNGNAIFIDSASVFNGTINNTAGTISTGAGTGAAINVGGTSAHVVAINNTAAGVISAGTASGNAILIANGTGAVTVTNSGTSTILGKVNLGNNAGSAINLTGGSITGLVTMGANAQALNLNGGQVIGDIAGSGTVKALVDYTAQGNITANSVVVTDGKVLTTGTNTVTSAVTVGTGAAGATLTLGTGAVTGAIDSSQAAAGIINFTASNTLGVGTNIGATTGFATINIADGATVSAVANNNTLKATNIYLGTTATGATLSLGNGAVTGAIDSKVAGAGTINFNGGGTNTTAGAIGATSGIAAINVANGATVVLNADAKATTTTVGAGTSGVLQLNTAKTITGAVNIAAGGILNQQAVSTITGLVNGSTAGAGTYNVVTAGANTFSTNNAIGSTLGLASFKVGDSVTATLAHNIKATNVQIGDGASGIANQTAGLITGNLILDDGALFTINGGSGVTGTVDGQSASAGTLGISSAFTSPSTLGSANGLAAINVNSGGTLTLGGNVKAVNTTVATGGVLNLGNTARTVTGILAGTGTGTINAGTATHTVTGNFTTQAGNVIGVVLNSGTTNDSGKIASGGTVTYTAGTTIAVDTSKLTNFVNTGTKYAVVTGTGANTGVGAVTGNTNFLTFAEDISVAGTRSIVATRAATYQSVATNANARAIGTSLNTLGNNADVQVSALQARLDATTTTAAFNAVMEEVTPQIQATSISANNTVMKSLDVVATRGSDLRAGIDNSVHSGMTAGNAVADKGIWAQAFGTTASQDTEQGVAGFDADTYGFAAGADMLVADHTRAGLSVSYGNTEVDSSGTAVQNTDIDTYQVNLYGFHDMGAWYADGLLGYAWQEYDSNRFISGPASTARSNYDGQTYTVRANTGYRMSAGNGIQIIPNGGLTYINNQIDGYTETGAGGLNLRVNDYETQALYGRIGVDLAKDFNSGSTVIRPTVRAAYLYDFIGDEASTNALFTGGGAAFRVSDADPERSSFNAGASLNVMTTGNITLSADYDYLARNNFDAHSGMLRARFGF